MTTLAYIIAGIMLLITIPVWGQDCVLTERTVTQHHVEIQERSAVRRDVVPQPNGGKKCMVQLRVRIGSQWHMAFGEHAWDGHQSSNEACAIAVNRAEDDVRQRVGKGKSVSERVLVCSDRPEMQELRNSVVGTVAQNHEFRPHPNYPNRFWYQGTQCRWFLEPAFTDRGIYNFQGIVCELAKDRWVVVDRF
jgi:hypothetical protein